MPAGERNPHDIRGPEALDEVDRSILAALAADGRMSNAALAETVGVAPSTSLARVRSLTDRGVITGFRATIDPRAVGRDMQALISVGIRAGARANIARFAEEIRALPEVIQVFFLGGAEDFIVHVAARDSDGIRDFVLEALSANPLVASTRTSMVFDHHFIGVDVAR